MVSQTPDLHESLEQTTQKSTTRQCFLLRVRPDRLPEYIDVH